MNQRRDHRPSSRPKLSRFVACIRSAIEVEEKYRFLAVWKITWVSHATTGDKPMRTILPLIIILGGLCSAVAQGNVIFVNGFAVFRTVADRRVYGPDCAPLVGTNYVAGLFYLPGAD